MVAPVYRARLPDLFASRAALRPQFPPRLVLVRLSRKRPPPTRPCATHAPRTNVGRFACSRTFPLQFSDVFSTPWHRIPKYLRSPTRLYGRRVFNLLTAHAHRMGRLQWRPPAYRIPDAHHAPDVAESRCCCAGLRCGSCLRNGMGGLDGVRVCRDVHRCVCICSGDVELP